MLPNASWGAVDRAMRLLGLEGARRAKGVCDTVQAKDGIRAGNLLNRDFTAPRPDHTWVIRAPSKLSVGDLTRDFRV